MQSTGSRIFAVLAAVIVVATIALAGVLLAAPKTPVGAAVAMSTAQPSAGMGRAAAIPTSQPPGVANDPPVTLRLAIADPVGRQSEPAARSFVARVAALSGGSITIQPTFDAGANAPAAFEEGVAALVKRGDADLGIAASRVWDLAGTTSLQALQAPFLIDTDALALAVAKSDIAKRALEGMTSAGVVGLALWPEDLRHLFSFPLCGKDLGSLAGLAGSTILIQPSAATRALLRAFGGLEYIGSDRGVDADACRLQGQEAGLVGAGLPLNTAVAVGNITLFPKYQVLVANPAVMDHLSAGQQAILRQAAADTVVGAYTRQPSEPDLATKWCAQGGVVVLAGDDQVAALKAAARPVLDAMERDPLTRALIADITTLKAATPPSAGAGACGSPVVSPTPRPSFPVSDLTGYVGTLPPDGSYRSELRRANLMALGAPDHFATINAGIWTITFSGSEWTSSHRGGQTDEDCSGTITSDGGKFLRLVTSVDHGCGWDNDIVWRLDHDGLAMRLVGLEYSGTVADFRNDQILLERTWTKVK